MRGDDKILVQAAKSGNDHGELSATFSSPLETQLTAVPQNQTAELTCDNTPKFLYSPTLSPF